MMNLIRKPNLLKTPENKFFKIWIKYFTFPYESNANINSNNQMPDSYLNSIKYKPTPIKLINKKVKQSHDNIELENNLASLFEFQKYSLPDFLNFCETVLKFKYKDSFSEENSPPNYRSIPLFVMQGFIILSHCLKQIVHDYLSQQNNDSLPVEYLKKLHLPLFYLIDMSDNTNKLTRHTMKCVHKYLNAFSDFDKIIKLNNNDPLKTSFKNILIFFMPFFQKAMNEISSMDITVNSQNFVQKSHSSQDVLFYILSFYFNVTSKPLNNEFEQKQIDINIINYIFTTLSDNISKLYSYHQIEFYTNYLINIYFFSNISKENTINFSKICVQNFVNFKDYLDPSTLKTIIKSFIKYIEWLTNQFSINDTYEILPTEHNDIGIKFMQWDDYFQNELIVPPWSIFISKSPEIEEFIGELTCFLEKIGIGSLNILLNILNKLIPNIKEFEQKLKVSIIFYRALSTVSITPSSIILEFLKVTFFENCFPNQINSNISSLEHFYQLLYIYFISHFSLQSQEHMNFILQSINFQITGLNFPKSYYFLPFFRNCLHNEKKITFVQPYVESDLYKDLSVINLDFFHINQILILKIFSFYQVMLSNFPIESFSSLSFISVIKNSLLLDNYHIQKMILPCFKIGLEKSIEKKETKISSRVIDTLILVLCDSVANSDLLNVAIEIISIITSLLDLNTTRNKNIINEFVDKQFIVHISNLLSKYPNSDILFLMSLRFYVRLCNIFPEYIKDISSKTVYDDFLHVIKLHKFEVTQEIIDELICFMINEKCVLDTNLEKCEIANKNALKLLVKSCKDTKFEINILSFILSICRVSTSNCFICFTSDIMGHLLKRLHKKELYDISFELFKVIGTEFFSPLTMNETFKATTLILQKDETTKLSLFKCVRPPYLNKFLEGFCQMISANTSIPISSYFNFNIYGKFSGIKDILLNETNLFFPFAISTSFRVKNFNNCLMPIFSLTNTEEFGEEGNKFILFLQGEYENEKNLFYLFINQNEKFNIKVNQASLSPNKWYELIVIFNSSTSVQINVRELSFNNHLNNRISQDIKIFDFKFSKLKIGYQKLYYFRGDLGPFFVIKSTSINDIRKASMEINIFRNVPNNIIISILPWNVNNNIINKIDKKGKMFAKLGGHAIPFCSVITDVFQLNDVYEHFFPLFLLLNYESSNLNANNKYEEDDDLFNILLFFLKQILMLSKKNQENFEKICGFRILSGIFFQLNSNTVNNFSCSIASSLFQIFSILVIPSLKLQMIHHIWLNFILWSRTSYEFQKLFYNKILYQVFENGKEFFEIKSNDFLLFFIQISGNIEFMDKFKGIVYENETLFACNTETINNKLRSSFYSGNSNCNFNLFLTNEQEESILKLKWKFMDHLLENHSSLGPTFLVIFHICICHENELIRMFSLKLIRHFLIQKNQELLFIIDSLKHYQVFFNILKLNIENQKIAVIALQCLLISIQLYPDLIQGKNTIIKEILHLLIHHTIISPKRKLSFLLDPKFNGKYEPIEFLPLFVYCSQYFSDKEIINYNLKISETMIYFPEQSLNNFFNNEKSWFLWLFILGFSSSADEYIQASHLYAIVIYEFLKNNKIDKIHDFFVFLKLLKIEFNIDETIDQIFSLLLNILCNRSITESLSVQKKKILLTIMFKELFIKISYLRKKEEIYDNESLINSLYQKSLENNFNAIDQIKNDIVFEVTFCPQKVNQSQSDSQTLLVFHHLLNHMDTALVEDECIEIFSGSSISIKSLMNITNIILNKSGNIDEGNLEKHSELISSLKLKVKPLLSQFKNDLVNNIEMIQKALFEYFNVSSEVLTINENENEEMKMFLSEFIESNKKTFKLTTLHNHKLTSSFLRESFFQNEIGKTSNSSFKWKATSRINYKGQNNFWTLNKNFDDHAKASHIRDSILNSKVDNLPKSNNDVEIPFKRILAKTQDHSKTYQYTNVNASFSVTLFTITNQISGYVYITSTSLIFDGSSVSDIFGNELKLAGNKFIEISILEIAFIFSRKTLHQDIGAEIFTYEYKSYLINFSSKTKRNEFLSIMKNIVKKNENELGSTDKNHEKMNINSIFQEKDDFLKYFRKACGCCVQTMSPQDLLIKSKIVQKWQQKEISNFTYIFCLNVLSSRSLNDLSQYPVFPWILSNYTDEKLDLNNPNNFRDLGRPIGAMNIERLNTLKEFMKEMDDPTQKCLYRSHYSNPAMVIGYLIRTEPFSSLHITLQDGKYDHPSRLFYSIGSAWNSVISENLDFREIIPEFFCSPSFLINENHFDLGKVNNKNIGNVQLPPWSNNNPYQFVAMHRMALESNYVSEHINEWIDLIFGIYQFSQEKNNIFHYFTYDFNENPDYEIIARNHCANFGSCPTQLFSNNNSPSRETISIQNILLPKSNSFYIYADIFNQPIDGEYIEMENDHLLTTKYFDKKIAINSFIREQTIGYNLTDLSFKLYNGLIICFQKGVSACASVFNAKANKEVGLLLHKKCAINCLAIDSRYIVTCGSNCVIFIWDASNLSLINEFYTPCNQIKSVDCSSSLNLIAFINQSNHIYVYALQKKKFINCFQVKFNTNINLYQNDIIEDNQNQTQLIKIIKSGLIAVSFSVLGKEGSILRLYDIKGNLVASYNIQAKCEKITTASFIDGSEYILVATNKKVIHIIDCANLEEYTKKDKYMIPGTAIILSSSKHISYLMEKESIYSTKMFGL